MSIIIDLLSVFTNLTPDIIDIYTDLMGIPCDIYKPLKGDRIYSDNTKVQYNKNPDILKQQYLVLNFIRPDAFRGTSTQYESFFNDDRPYILTHDSKRLDPRTRVDVWFKNAKMSFQTEIDQVITGVRDDGSPNSTILVKQILRPLT